MAQTTISIRMDDHLKHQFEEFCGAIGMSMTTAFNVFAKAAVREMMENHKFGKSGDRIVIEEFLEPVQVVFVVAGNADDFKALVVILGVGVSDNNLFFAARRAPGRPNFD